LQLSRMELMDLVRQEEEENPILEEVTEPSSEIEPIDANYETQTTPSSETKEEREEKFGLPEMDWRADDHSWGTSRGSDEDDDRPTFESFLTKKATLSDHLLWQLRL